MEIRHLRYFVALAEELHFGRAANRLNIVQPALSQQIRKLEDELEVKLFARNKRRVELTHAGQAFLAEARQILSQAAKAVRVAQRADRGEIGPLTIACSPISTYAVLPLIMKRYRTLFPQVEINLRECLMTEAVQALEKGTADVGVLLPYFHSEVLKRETILRIPLLAVLPKSHRLARARSISLKQLASDPFILFPYRRGSGFYEHVVSLCRKAGFTPKVMEGVEQFPTLLLMVAAGYGVSLIPAFPKITGNPEIARVRLIEPYAAMENCAAWRAKESSPLVAGFLHAVRACCREAQRKFSRGTSK